MNITSSEYAELRNNNARHILLDVRTAEELALARLDPCVHIPVQELSRRLAELEGYRGTQIICMCHHGMRSASAASILRNAGFQNVLNLTGGIDAYAREVDEGVGVYG